MSDQFPRDKRQVQTTLASGMDFDTIFTKARPHILEKICLSLDYESFKKCLEVNKAWMTVLTATAFQNEAK